MGSGNTSQKSDEEDFVKVEDLPLQLTVMCEVRNTQTDAYILSELKGNLGLHLWKPMMMYCLVSQGGTTQENSGGATE